MRKNRSIILIAALLVIFASFTNAQSQTYEDYEKRTEAIKTEINKNPNTENVDRLYYEIAEARLEELAILAKKNDIESVRLYMKVNDEYFNEAILYLDRTQKNTTSKSVILDVYTLKFLIAKERFQPEVAVAMFNEIAKSLAAFSKDPSINKDELTRISEKLLKKGFPEDALKLMVTYASIIPPKDAQAIAENIKYQADLAFEKNNYKQADTLYKHYTDIAKKVYKNSEVARSLVDIADSYFKRNHFREALTYYEEYLDKYSDFEHAAYCTYNAGKCFYISKNFPHAISQFKRVLNKYSDSIWFDKAFMALAKIYYETPKEEKAIADLEMLIEEYPKRDIRDYAELLIIVLYYSEKDYGTALKRCENLNKNYPKSKFSYAVNKLVEDMDNIKKNKDAPAYKFDSEDTYKRWSPYTPINAKIVLKINDSQSMALKAKKTISNFVDFETKVFAESPETDTLIKVLASFGQVTVLPKDSKTNWTNVSAGMFLKKGDTIKTGPLASCDIAFDGDAKNVVGILENSDVAIVLDGQEKLSTMDAHIYARLSAIPHGSSFEIKTPQAVCGARGTGFGMKSRDKVTEALAFEDNISVRNTYGNEENIEQGFLRKIDDGGNISEALEVSSLDTAEFQAWPIYITVKPGTMISFTLEEIEDIDKFGEYLYDKEDESRLPKKIGDETTKDLLSISWESTDGGEFTNEKQTSDKIWRAPIKPGVYKVVAQINDLGLTRPPDEGIRKDINSAKTTVVVIVKE